MTLEMGKAVAESKAEITYAAEFFRWFSGEALRIDGDYKVAGNGASRVLIMRQPVGPCFFITPWNFPTAMGTRKVGPAIAAGCTMVWKPAKLTPLSALALADLLAECGLPDGVLNVVVGESSGGIAEPVISDDRLRKLSFTGSTEVGRSLIAQAADQVLNVSMELGGNAPFLVFDDADLDAALEGAMIAKMRNIGEACTSANRFHVAEPLADEFASGLAERMGKLKIGRGTEEGVDIGPLIDEDQRGKVAELVEDATSKGAKALVGGSTVDGAGYFYEPTVLADVPDDARLLREEIFGPVAPVATFDSEEAADRRRQRHRVRPRRLRLHPRHQARAARLRGPRDRDDRPEPGHGLERRRAVRRRQAVRHRPRGRQRGDRGVPRDEVRRGQPLKLGCGGTRRYGRQRGVVGDDGTCDLVGRRRPSRLSLPRGARLGLVLRRRRRPSSGATEPRVRGVPPTPGLGRSSPCASSERFRGRLIARPRAAARYDGTSPAA